ncbi:MAG: hypothetical protein HOK06_03000, partial [Rhodospirillaceae bacterium]|nr:hypothetical protein [Rhodospirillaceae bacterium]
NLFGQGQFNSAGSIKKVLTAVGHSNTTLPLAATFPADLFSHDLKSANQKLKDDLLKGLKLDLPLPKLSIPGMPNIVGIDTARLSIVGADVKGKAQVFAGLTGGLHVKIGSKTHHFSYGMFAPDPHKAFTPEIKAESKDTIKLPFFHPLDLTNVQLVATKKNNKWNAVVNAKAKLNNKEMDVVYTRDRNGALTAEVKGKIKLADLLPGGVSIPGITDVEFDDLRINKNLVEVRGPIKGVDTVIAAFKHGGKTYVAVNNPHAIKISELISAAKGTPLDAGTFKHMSYIWAPNGGAADISISDLPVDIGFHVKYVARSANVKPGLNVIGRMDIDNNSSIGKMLNKVGIHKKWLPLVGNLSPKLFQKGNTAQLKNEILNSLDIEIPLPKLNLPGVSNVATIKSAMLTLKGAAKNGKSSVDVDIAGELDVKMAGKTTPFDFDLNIEKRQGKPSYFNITAEEQKGRTLSVDMFHKFTFSNIKFAMNNSLGKWLWYITGDSKLHNKPVSVAFNHTQGQTEYVQISTKMTLAEIVGESSLPGLDAVEIDWVNIQKRKVQIAMKVKGVASIVYMFKPSGATKSMMALLTGDFSPAKFIPGAEHTPLKDADFKGLGFLYNRNTQAIRINASNAPDVSNWLRTHANVDSVTAKPGLNVFGKLAVHPEGEMKTLLTKVGITDLNIPLNGTLSPKSFSANPTAIKNAILDNLDIKVNLPTPHIAAMANYLTFTNGHMQVKGTKTGNVRGIDIGISGDATVKVKNETVAFAIDVDYDRSGGGASSDLHVTGATTRPWTHP